MPDVSPSRNFAAVFVIDGVADESLHPLAHRCDLAAAQAWLARHGPALAELLAEAKSEDFGARSRPTKSKRATD